MIARLVLIMTAAALLGGCGGQYMAAMPDVVAAEGRTARVAVQLRRQEFWRFAPPVADAALTVRLDDGPRRAAFTDADGYAAVPLAAPAQPGRYSLTLHLQDAGGVEFTQVGRCYVLDSRRLALAVDWRCVQADDAAEGPLRALHAAGVQIVYVVKGGGDGGRIHEALAARELPDGPVISWDGRRTLPGALPAARRALPSLVVLATDRDDLARCSDALNMAAAGADPDWIALAVRVSRAAAALRGADFGALRIADVRSELARP
ncbi:MAG: hypothetical protein GX591_04390 [Planctomycetes bacterium]|nr:hypothetical protein [Planctomycetota bacterium]